MTYYFYRLKSLINIKILINELKYNSSQINLYYTYLFVGDMKVYFDLLEKNLQLHHTQDTYYLLLLDQLWIIELLQAQRILQTFQLHQFVSSAVIIFLKYFFFSKIISLNNNLP